MNRKLVVRQATEADVLEAAVWYEEQRFGLGGEFMTAARECVERIKANPFGYPITLQQVRRAMLHKFPYGLYYTVSDKKITVHACMHSSRDPIVWQERIDD